MGSFFLHMLIFSNPGRPCLVVLYALVPSYLIIHISLGVGITGIARVTVGVALLLTGVIRRLSRLLLGRLAGLKGLHLTGNGVWSGKLIVSFHSFYLI